MKNCVVLGGSSHPELTSRICHELDIDPSNIETKKFVNGETSVNIADSVREKQVYVIQSGGMQANDSLMELLIMISACKTASAKSVTAVLPLFPYSRQANVKDALRVSPHAAEESASNHSSVSSTSSDKDIRPTERPIVPRLATPAAFSTTPQASPIKGVGGLALNSPLRPGITRTLSNATTTRNGTRSNSDAANKELAGQYNNGYKYWIAQTGPLIALLLSNAGADHVITLDLHDPQFQGFFDVPVDNLHAQPLMEQFIMAHVPHYRDAVIVSPDAGGAKRATSIADRLGLPFALMHKDGRNNASILVGNVTNRVAIIIDDIVDTARTLVLASRVIKDHGALKIYAIVTHGVFSGNAAAAILKSPIDLLITTNSVSTDIQRKLGDRHKTLDVAPMFGEAIRRIHNGESISLLFDHAVGVV